MYKPETLEFTNLLKIRSLHLLVSENHQGWLNILVEEIQEHKTMKWCEHECNIWLSVEMMLIKF